MRLSVAALWLFVAFSFSHGVCQEADSVKVRKTSPGGALFRSAFVPGWGQLYNRKYIKAVIFAAGESWLAYGIYNDWKEADEHERNFKSPPPDDLDYQAMEFAKYEDARDRRNLKMWILSATIFYSMFDAFVDAHLSDFQQSDKAFEVYLGPGDGHDFKVSLTFNIL